MLTLPGCIFSLLVPLHCMVSTVFFQGCGTDCSPGVVGKDWKAVSTLGCLTVSLTKEFLEIFSFFFCQIWYREIHPCLPTRCDLT